MLFIVFKGKASPKRKTLLLHCNAFTARRGHNREAF